MGFRNIAEKLENKRQYVLQLCLASNNHSNVDTPFVELHFDLSNNDTFSSIDMELHKEDLLTVLKKMEQLNVEIQSS